MDVGCTAKGAGNCSCSAPFRPTHRVAPPECEGIRTLVWGLLPESLKHNQYSVSSHKSDAFFGGLESRLWLCLGAGLGQCSLRQNAYRLHWGFDRLQLDASPRREWGESVPLGAQRESR